MKVIISHDIDHLSAIEHLTDSVIPKHIIRSCIEYSLGHISVLEVGRRLRDVVRNKLNNLEDLLKYDKAENVPSTFFAAVSRGKGLTYDLQYASLWIRMIMEKGFDIGLHGISFESLNEMKQEWTIFKELSGMLTFGIRMHYLRCNETTIRNLSNVGYTYDSSVTDLVRPYKIGNMWEFPLHIMDGRMFCVRSRWQNRKLAEAKDSTKRTIDYLYSQEIPCCTVCFHDMHFTESFKDWREWYMWLIRYLKDNAIRLISFNEAIRKLEELT